MTKVTREFSFEAAHMLSGYEGQCQNLHGHSYKLQVTLKGCPKNSTGESDSEMVMDFTDLKAIVEDRVISKVDHAVLFSSKKHRREAEEVLLQWAQTYNMRHVVLNGRSTCETIAAWIRSQLVQPLGNNICVRVWETAKSFAEV
jgi:6-pyruvoyltetrahydropterin/6-carboxytetrahydropterin synthase